MNKINDVTIIKASYIWNEKNTYETNTRSLGLRLFKK